MADVKKKSIISKVLWFAAAAVAVAAAAVFAVRYFSCGEEPDMIDSAFLYQDFEKLPEILDSAAGAKSRSACAERILTNAENLIGDKAYQAALSLCDILDQNDVEDVDTSAIRRTAADAMAADGDYEAARELYVLAGTEETDSAVLLCDYNIAETYFRQEDFLTALPLYEKLGDYGDSPDRAEACRNAVYQQATELMYSCDFVPAGELFTVLDSYMDSGSKAEFCIKREELKNDPPRKPPKWVNRMTHDYPNGTLYSDGEGELYIPHEINADTVSLVYFAGGIGQNYLYGKGLDYYLRNYDPNAVMYFYYSSGFFSMDGYFKHAVKTLEEAAVYCDFVVHDMVTVGSSHGAYSAIKGAARFYSDYGYPVRSVVSLDAGEYFQLQESEEKYFLTENDYDSLAEAGTVMLLFEEPGMSKTDNNYINRMRDKGVPVYIIECRDGNHDRISVNAYKYGLFSWAVGEFDEIDAEEYTIFEVK